MYFLHNLQLAMILLNFIRNFDLFITLLVGDFTKLNSGISMDVSTSENKTERKLVGAGLITVSVDLSAIPKIMRKVMLMGVGRAGYKDSENT